MPRRRPRTEQWISVQVLAVCDECDDIGVQFDTQGRAAVLRVQAWARSHAIATGHEPRVAITRSTRYVRLP